MEHYRGERRVTGRMSLLLLIALLFQPVAFAQTAPEFDLLIQNGTIYDGSGREPRRADLLIKGDRIVGIGDFRRVRAAQVVDARGLAVAPGFINMLSWAVDDLLVDGRSMGDLLQGVTTEIFGEGTSMGPLTEEMKIRQLAAQSDVRFPIEWTTLGEYLRHLERRGVSCNVASFIGATTIREHVVGLADRAPTTAELQQMRELVSREMADGALGIGSSLIYAPGFYAKTDELIELCKVAAAYNGKYISHMRSEGNRLLEALDELLRIAREARIPAEIYHLKAAGSANFRKMDEALAKIERARRDGLRITADMYTYTAGATGLTASMPPWVLDGGYPALFSRLADPETRRRIATEISTPSDQWENLYLSAGSPERILLVDFRSEALRKYIGRTLAEVARERGEDPVEAIMNLILEDRSRIGTVYFMMSEENIRKQLKYPWVSFGSDAGSMATEGVFLKTSTHPRAYGNFARLLGKYVREEKVISLTEAIRRLTSLPAGNLGLARRGRLRQGYFADVVVFDPAKVTDRATFDRPHQYAEGMVHVFVNGRQVIRDGRHTGETPGRALRGPGRTAPAQKSVRERS